MKKLSLIALLLFCFQLNFAQTDLIRKEILSSDDSQSIVITKGRALLLEKFLSGDLAKMAEIESYLTNKLSNGDYLSLYPIERWLVKYWTKDYDRLIQDIGQYDSVSTKTLRKVIPPYDNLLIKLSERSYAQKQAIVDSINHSALPLSDKEFLKMHLYSCLATDETLQITQDTLNNLSDNFIQKYPNNKLIDYTRKYIRYKLKPSKWGFGFEFFSGYGIFTGSLKDHYTNNIPFGVAFDVAYKGFTLYLRDYIGFNRTKHDFTGSSEVWPKKSNVRVYLPEASLGYTVRDSKRMKLSPFVGISSMDIGPTEYDLEEKRSLEDYELTFTTTYTLGFNVDIKLGKSKAGIVTRGPEQGYLFLRLRYAYNFPQFSKSYNGFDGNMHCVTVGFGGFGRRIKRDY